ncbi:hypothetical protein MHK_010875 [Candidatus Magnetomorum sp. HK-1]|nr:hypothetical protein MHK_010875 [Candidatus Magnetomorum sp. HK-1]
MKYNKGFTLFEIVITLLVIFILSAYIIPVVGSKLFYFDKPIIELQEIMNLKMIIENITHDYTNRCFAGTKFTLEDLRKRIGPTGYYINNLGFRPEIHPYGFSGGEYIRYFVKFNDFVKEYQGSNTEIHLVKDYSKIKDMLLVTIQLDSSSEKSLTVLFTKKEKE